MTPLVSVLVPCHNAAPWLGTALASVRAQTWERREIILVNDGSTDDSLAVAHRLAGPDLKIITQPNRGQSAALNTALRHAQGDYIKFLDADDLLSPETLAAQVAPLVDKPDHLAYGTWGRFYHDPAETVFTPHAGWHDSAPIDWVKETWRDTEPMYQCALFLIPRSLLARTGGWDERLSLINDFEFFTRLVLDSAGLIFTPAAKLYYRSGLPGSLSRRKSRGAWESAVLSTNLAVNHLLARENTMETRRLCADMLQKLRYGFYPEHSDLNHQLLARITELGGSARQPGGGPSFHALSRVVGWKLAARIRFMLGRRPV